MYRFLSLSLALAACLSLSAPAPARAQSSGEQAGDAQETETDAAEARGSEVEEAGSELIADAQPDPGASPQLQLPSSPTERLERAQEAFENADYDILRPLLEPVLLPHSQLTDADRERRARALLAVGLYFEAQQVTDAARRQELLEAVDAQFLAILLDEPDFSLNPLIYPASVVERFNAVKDEHAEELDAIRADLAAQDGAEHEQGMETIYISREIERRSYALNFFPLGVGQFQNGERVQGTFFAASQVAALGLNVASYAMIESLRGPNGLYEPGPGNAADVAHQWRVAQYVGLGAFVGLYAWSVIDALVGYSPTRVRIRTLDGPPPELNSGGADDNEASFQIGWGGFGFSW